MRPRHPRLRSLSRTLALPPLLTLAGFALAGCEEPRHVAGEPKPQVKKAAEAEDPFIVGKRTQEIRPADAEVKKGAQVVTPRITAKDPITITGNAYVSMIGQTSVLNIKHAMDLYQGANDRYPKDLDEFMTEIIKANNTSLPKLPFYQKYGYDEKEHKLVILEYPDLKAGPLPGQSPQ
jgi:hypothetical protein